MILDYQLPLARGTNWLTLIIFLVIVFGPVVVQFLKKLRGTTEDEPPGSPRRSTPPREGGSPQPRPYNADSEEIRKFLEALGKPRTAPPPPPRPAAPPPVLRPVQPPVPRPQPQRPPPRPTAPRPPAPVVAEGVSEELEEEGPRNVITGERTRQEFKPLERVDLTEEMRNAGAEVAHAMERAGAATPAHVSVIVATRAADYRKLLAEKATVRQAFVLAEIIGPPKALS